MRIGAPVWLGCLLGGCAPSPAPLVPPALCAPTLRARADWPRVRIPGTELTMRLPPSYSVDSSGWRLARGRGLIRFDTRRPSPPPAPGTVLAAAEECAIELAGRRVRISIQTEFGGTFGLQFATVAIWQESPHVEVRIIAIARDGRAQVEQVAAIHSLSP